MFLTKIGTKISFEILLANIDLIFIYWIIDKDLNIVELKENRNSNLSKQFSFNEQVS